MNRPILAIIAYFCAFALSPSIQAAEFSCPSGDVACLIARINEANANGEPTNTINLGPGSFTLTQPFNNDPIAVSEPAGLPTIRLRTDRFLDIIGAGAASTIIERDDAGGVPFRIFNVLGEPDGTAGNSGVLSLSGLTIRRGNAQGSGGAILNVRGRVNLSNVIVADNTASASGGGLAGESEGRFTLTNAVVIGNSAGGSGGGIAAPIPGVLNISDSTIQGNKAAKGGGIFGNNVRITGSTISGNEALGPDADGGGIWAAMDGFNPQFAARITNSTISNNMAVRNGGGIFNTVNTAPIMLENVTISNNKASGGGGIFNQNLDLGGGGIFKSLARVKNSLIVNNPAGNDCLNVISDPVGHNLDSDNTCGLPAGQTVRDPLLGPLANNGGPTQTHALLLGSPAIDAILPPDCTDLAGQPITTDQRGVARPFGAACDIGAFEFGPLSLRMLADVNGDRRADYCRFVGDPPNIFLSCNLATATGFDSNQYGFNSIHGIDQGYPHLPRMLVDVNGDGRADYCRFVGDPPDIFLSCDLATATGFDSNQYGFNSIQGIDQGFGP